MNISNLMMSGFEKTSEDLKSRLGLDKRHALKTIAEVGAGSMIGGTIGNQLAVRLKKNPTPATAVGLGVGALMGGMFRRQQLKSGLKKNASVIFQSRPKAK